MPNFLLTTSLGRLMDTLKRIYRNESDPHSSWSSQDFSQHVVTGFYQFLNPKTTQLSIPYTYLTYNYQSNQSAPASTYVRNGMTSYCFRNHSCPRVVVFRCWRASLFAGKPVTMQVQSLPTSKVFNSESLGWDLSNVHIAPENTHENDCPILSHQYFLTRLFHRLLSGFPFFNPYFLEDFFL